MSAFSFTEPGLGRGSRRRSGRPDEPSHAAGLEGLLLALEHELLGYANRFGEEASEPGGQQDLSSRGVALEARRRIDDVADGGEVVHSRVADVADEGFAEVEPDADVELWNARRAVADAVEQFTSCPTITLAIRRRTSSSTVAAAGTMKGGTYSAMTSSPISLSMRASGKKTFSAWA